MMENKYYTPKMEEFHEGFEYEFKHRDYPDSEWKKCLTPEWNPEREDSPLFKTNLSEYRVKYLDREDMEKEGFIIDRQEGFTFVSSSMLIKGREIKEGLEIIYNTESKWLLITTGGNVTRFSGECKNISEFRKLIKMLKISDGK